MDQQLLHELLVIVIGVAATSRMVVRSSFSACRRSAVAFAGLAGFFAITSSFQLQA
jgi:hypothetical protein